MDADIAILSQDITALTPEEYLGIRCDVTLRGGIPIHDRHDEFSRGEFA